MTYPFLLLIYILIFIAPGVYVGRIGSKREIGFLLPFIGSIISSIIGFYYIGFPIIFKGTFSETIGICILVISVIGGPLITLAITLLSERK
jgi:hypothetical protein